ncbi:patatin-like phospholipase family protein [Bradyrhizobium sp. 41S5]|uniref:patatin-like phospholipase family protein n=1 Tax=Bradyrhizobium sp. 41S5 TaxID=1404443 RepID=UPI00156B6D66|nr:patatin-like phospholipase family protein [Bradyrhizobium sp. 41S5]UFX49001.1 patatin-like phospholipase family protein [Bradyrhizobium sp. 41S5]
MRWLCSAMVAVAASAALLGCVSVYNLPVNVPLDDAGIGQLNVGLTSTADDILVGLSFSGGGTRAAAFSFGVLSELDTLPVRGAEGSMLDRVEFVSGVSGGSVTAAYYGLKKRLALKDFRERFLLKNAEEGLTTTVSLGTIGRAFTGGVNDSRGFTAWLDANLLNGATLGDLSTDRPRVWINATDIFNRVPFVFGSTAFTAICSDLSKYPISDAVAASAAVPIAFAPVVVQAFPGACTNLLPPWVRRLARDRKAPPMVRSYAAAIASYRDGVVPFIKLLDGGLVDNYGISGLTIARESSDTPYGPLTPQQAVKLRRALFLVVDAKTGIAGDWVHAVDGPNGVETVRASVASSMAASLDAIYTVFNRTMNDWQTSLVRWRCQLSATDRARFGVGPGWNCQDLKFFVGRLGFDQFDPERAAELDAVPTRFQLPPDQVDNVIAAGRDALRESATLQAFVKSR